MVAVGGKGARTGVPIATAIQKARSPPPTAISQ